MPAHHSTTSPLVGRDADLDHLAGLLGLDRGADGGPRSGMVLLAGDAGVGKTRVLVELARRAEQAGWQVLAGHCLDFGDSALPYLPFTEMLGRLAHRSEALSEALAEAHPAVRHLQPGRRLLAGPASADEETMERAELFEAVHAVFERLAAAAPLLVVVEDTHWADRSTRDLLSFLFTRPFTGPVSLLVSYRSDDLHRRHPLRATTAQWSRVPGLHRVVLGPLSDTAVRSLVRSLHTSPMPAAEVRAIVERAEGNAFFVEELVAATELGGSTLPEDLADLLLVRLDQLDDAGRLVVRAAACAGRQVSHALLAAVVDLAPDDLDRALRSAVESNVLVPGGANSYAFRHALLAEAVYDDLLPGERVRIHAAYAVALRSHKVDGTAAELARHARAAHDLVTAVTASIEAGDDAMSVGGPDEAARHYETALELLGNAANRPAELGDVDLVSLTARASDAMLASGDLHRALSLVQDQLAHLPADAPVTDRVTLLMTLGLAAIMGDTPVNALEVTSEAMALLPVEPTRLRARLMAAHAWANAEWQRDEEAMRWAQDARELGGRLGLRRVVADATTTIARLEERAGNPEESKRVFEKIVAQARTDGDVHAELRGLHHLGGLHFEAGQFAEAQRYYSRAVVRAAETNRPWSPYGFDTRVMGAIAAYITGDWDEVARIVDVTGEAPPELIEVSLAAIGLGVAAGRGDAEALRTFQRVRPWWDKDGVVAIYSGAAAIDLYADSGDYESAIRVYEEVVDSVTALWQVSTFLARFR
ncbi:MAG TPA: AAA family ATPase, partial [Nocardioidaceae bacterium]|nr:AAA family ATPase [Nocardioidaceae bacterium]